MDIKSQLHMWQLIIVWLWFEQAFKADVVAVIYEGPASQRIYSISEANLMFEFLLGGVELDQDNKYIVLLDKELASMRQGRAFLALINDNIPRTQSSMEEMLSTLKDKQKKPLSQKQFQSLILSMVFSAHQARRQQRRDEQMAWGQILIQLANVTTNELRGQYLINYV